MVIYWVFLTGCAAVIIAVLFFLFYSNRVLGRLLSRLIRAITWRKYRAYIEIESIQFAPLAGRILFKNLKYFSRNQSITVLKGSVTWRYWLWSVREDRSQGNAKNDDGGDNDKNLPCRVICNLNGVEWFVYNRKPAYDALSKFLDENSNTVSDQRDDVAVNLEEDTPDDSQISFFRRLLPIQIDCERGAVIVGNPYVPSVLITEFAQASGIYAALKTRSQFDHYKAALCITFRNPRIHLRPNEDYKESPLTQASRRTTESAHEQPERSGRFSSYFNRLSACMPFFQNTSSMNTAEWYGLPRYLNDDLPGVPGDGIADEYAKVTTILECVSLNLNYYVDVAGKVPSLSLPDESNGIDIGNGDLAPEWTVELEVEGGVINYGPWADRQRVQLQNFFFPPLYRNSEKTKMLFPGDDRLHTALKVFIIFKTETVIRIPTREASKDWNFEESAPDEPSTHAARSYGWMDLRVGLESRVNVIVPMVTDDNGYSVQLDIRLDKPELQTSINFANLLIAERCTIACELQNPLVWNASRKWDFRIEFRKADIFLLRDHIILFQDLVKDWTSGPLVQLRYFIPINYDIQLNFKQGFQLFLYVNEHNIIENTNPMDADDNTFVIKGRELYAKIDLPFVQYKPEVTKILFDVTITHGNIMMSPQASHSLGAFLSEDGKNFGQVDNFTINGTYQYYSFVDPSHVESVSLNMKGKKVNLKLFGFVIRYFMIILENYAGDYINFVTLEEYARERSSPVATRRMPSKPPADLFEVYLVLVIEDGSLSLPENLYTAENCSTIQFHELQLELRNLDLYLDMDITVSPLTITLDQDDVARKHSRSRLHNNYLFLDGLNIYAHRLYGPQPKTAAYVCNWDINLGTISGQLRPPFLLSLSSFARAFAYHLVDEESALPADFANADVTFLNVKVKAVDVSIQCRDSCSQILLSEGICAQYDNLASEKYLQRVILKIPELSIKSLAMVATPGSPVDTEFDVEDYPWVEVANFETAFDVTLLRTESGWRQRFDSQQAFVKDQDNETLRVPFLYEYEGDLRSTKINNDIVYAPPMPPPISDDSGPPRYRNDDLSSDIPAAENRKNVGFGTRYGLFDETDDLVENTDNEGFKTDNDSVTGSAVSISNTSFVTASDGDTTDEEFDSSNSESSDDTFTAGRHETEFYVDTMNYESNFPRRARFGHQIEKVVSQSEPISIPYGRYLRRYKHKSNAPQFTSSFLRPSRSCFQPARKRENSSIGETDSPSYTSSTFFKMKNEEAIEPSIENDSETLVTIIFEATKSINVLLTPIFLRIIQEMLEAISNENWNMEAMLDAMQTDYISKLNNVTLFEYDTARLVASIPKIHLHFIQDVLLPDDLTKVIDENSSIRTRYDLTDTILCTADLVLERTLFTGLVKFKDAKFDKNAAKNAEPDWHLNELRTNLELDALKVNVRFVTATKSVGVFGIPEDMHGFSDVAFDVDVLDDDPVVLHVSLRRLKINLSGLIQPNEFVFNMENLIAISVAQSAEIFTGAVYSWLVFIDDIAKISSDFLKRRKRQLQVLVSQIASFSNKARIESDPSHLTRPSHLLRLKVKTFKNDDGWKILGRLRHCKREMEKSTETMNKVKDLLTCKELHMNDSNAMYVTAVNAFSTWRHWEIGDLSKSQFFTKVFDRPHSTDLPARTVNIPHLIASSTNIGKLYIGLISFSVLEENRENSVKVGPLGIDAESSYRSGLPIVEAMQEPPLSPFRFGNVDSGKNIMTALEGYVDVVLRVHLNQVAVDVNPDMLAFAKHWLRVQRVFATRRDTMSAEIQFSRTDVAAGSSKNVGHKSTSTITSLQEIKTVKYKEKISNTDKKKATKFNLWARLEVVAHALVFIETVVLSASAQQLLGRAQFSSINISALLHSPQAMQLIEKLEIENSSVGHSSVKAGSRGSGRSSHKLKFSAAAGIRKAIMTIKELNSSSQKQVTLLSVKVSKVCANVTLSKLTSPRNRTKGDIERKLLNTFVGVKKVSVELPESLLKLFKFVEQWQEENLPQYDFLFKRLMDEWEVQRKKSSRDVMSIDLLEKASAKEKYPLEIKFQFLLEGLSFVSNLLPSLQLKYYAYNFMAMSQKGSTTKGSIIARCLGQLKKQEIHFVTRQSQKGKKPIIETANNSRDEYKQEAAFSIPAIRATGSMRPRANKKVTSLRKGNALVQQNYSQLESSLTLDSVKLGLNVNIIDHLLTTQSLLSSELNDALDLFIFSSNKYKERSASHRISSSSSVPEPTTGDCENKLIYTVRIALRGLRIAAASPTAVMFFETNVLNGLITNDPMISGAKKTDQPGWKFSAREFTLSLNPNTGFMDQASADEDIRKYSIAYILIDLALQNFRDKRTTDVSKSVMPEEIDVLESYFLKLSKVHAVMQPLALGRLMDLYVYYSSQLDRRKELKASDINDLANNTRKIINSFNVDLPKYKKTSKSLLDEKILSLEITQFAVALPLDLREEMILTGQNNGEISLPKTPALLFSASSMNFITRQWKSACASIKNLSLQFVNQFNSSVEDPFSSASNEKMNRVNYPEIYCKVHATGTKNNKLISVDSRVEGFNIHISGDIVNYINSLNEIYATSRERFETFAAEANIGSQLHLQSKSKSTLTNVVEESSIAINFEVQVAFAAKSGVMKLYPKNFLEHQQAKRSSKGSSKRHSVRSAKTNSVMHLQHSVSNYDIYSLDDTSKLEESGIDSITIPGLSLNTTYRTVLGEMVSSSAQRVVKRAHIELIVHPSENIFLPSLVPFIKDIINGLKIGVQRSSDKKATAVEKSESPIYGIDFTFYFKLSRTRFELSCRPTSVSCIVIWEEGNFLVSSNSSNSGQSLTLIGKIRGASGKVRHVLSPDDDNSASAETKDISFNATLMSRRTDTISDDSISIIADMPHITAGLNIRLLQELLILKAIWLDQATKLYEESMQGDVSRDVPRNYSRAASAVNTEAKAKPYSVYVMLRLQELDLSSDLGQAIGQVRFNTKNIRVKTKHVPNAIKSAMVSTNLLDIVADGRLKGFARMTGLNLFTLLQRPPTSQIDVRTSVSKFLFKTEQIQSSLEYEYQKILVAEIDPMELTVKDQWGGVNENRISTLVHTQVVTTKVQALASIRTIPVFINMGDKLIALIEGKRLSVANMTNKLVSPSSSGTAEHVEAGSYTNDSASALQQVLKDLIIDEIPITLIGKITLNIGLIHITVFPNHFTDVDCVQAKSDGLVLNLKRNAGNSTTLHRDLDMQLNNLSLTKGICKKFVHKGGSTRTIQEWFDHAAIQSAKNIFSLPRTHLMMETWTPMASDNNIVNHKFVTDFGGKVDIALNFGLILYLQELGVLYKEQLRRLALGTSDQLKSPTFADTKSKLQVETGDATNAESSSKAAKSSTAEPEKTKKEKKTIQYEPVEQVKLEPQLRIMGDATPPLEWAGLQRAKVPGFVHTTVTLNLDEVLSLVDNVYRQELQGFLSK